MFDGTMLRNPGWLGAVVLAGLFYLGGQYIASQPQRIKQETEANREISVQGSGEVTSKPDVARLNLGVTVEPQATAKQAIDQLATKFSAVQKAVEGAGVKKMILRQTIFR